MKFTFGLKIITTLKGYKWFAWYPVRLYYEDEDGFRKYAWLEYVMRTYYSDGSKYESLPRVADREPEIYKQLFPPTE